MLQVRRLDNLPLSTRGRQIAGPVIQEENAPADERRRWQHQQQQATGGPEPPGCVEKDEDSRGDHEDGEPPAQDPEERDRENDHPPGADSTSDGEADFEA